MVQNIIDAITNGYIAQQIQAIPATFQALALQRLGWSGGPVPVQPERRRAGLDLCRAADRALCRRQRDLRLRAELQRPSALSQSVAFDFRNDLYAKIQRLSFSYHDRNQTGQLMIRATDDVEKVRLFIGQGLLLAVQSHVHAGRRAGARCSSPTCS